MDTQTAYLLVISFYLTLPSSQSQSTQTGPWKHARPPLVQTDQWAGPPASLPVRDRYEEEEDSNIFPQKQCKKRLS